MPRRGLVLVAALLAGCGREDLPSVGPGRDFAAVAARLEPFIRQEMADKRLPGLSIALVDGDEIVWARGFGLAIPADSAPATARTVYRMGSVSKLITAAAIMRLVQAGRVALDSAVSTYLPEFHPANPFGPPVTVRHLLSHRGGLVREPPVGHYLDPAPVTLAEMTRRIGQTTLVYAPGSRIKYSNAGYVVLGRIVERVSGQSFHVFVEREIFARAGMNRSGMIQRPELDIVLAAGQLWTVDNRYPAVATFPVRGTPATGLYSSVVDVARFARGLWRGRVVSRAAAAEMWGPQGDSANPGPDFGLGFWSTSLDGRRFVGHGGSVHGFAVDVSLLPNERLAAVVATTADQATAVPARIASVALDLMAAHKAGAALAPIVTTAPVDTGSARRLDGVYGGRTGGVGRGTPGPPHQVVRLEDRAGRLFFHRDGDEIWAELRSLPGGNTLIVDDRLAYGDRIVPLGGGRLVVDRDTLTRVADPRPDPAPARLRPLIGEYGPDYGVLYVREEGGALHAQVKWFFDYPLSEAGPDRFRFPDTGIYHGETLTFDRGAGGQVTGLSLSGMRLARRAVGPADGNTFRITPLRPADELRRAALGASPPPQPDSLLPPDLVELTSLDPTIRLDIRYATANNFVGVPFYSVPRAFAQRPAAEAVVRAHRALARRGYGLLIHDAYRPWYVTKMFWDATPPELRDFVANPATGSRHNRGAAIDLSLYDRRTGRAVEMVSGYDEFSDRAYPDYPGGTSLQRWHRRLLRTAMEAEGFTVVSNEWWHFDYRGWRRYPVGNLRFEEIGR